MTHKDLIAKLEAAEGPSYALDCEIARAVGTFSETLRVPNYSASIDAAMTLVPEGWRGIRLYTSGTLSHCVLHFNGGAQTAEGKSLWSPAIALCIAALKAQEASND